MKNPRHQDLNTYLATTKLSVGRKDKHNLNTNNSLEKMYKIIYKLISKYNVQCNVCLLLHC